MVFYAGIVTYNPSIIRLKISLDLISGQVTKVLIIDNGSDNYSDIVKLVDDYSNTVLINNCYNKGIATALNQIMSFAKDEKAEWVLLLDQDSIVPNNIIDEYKPYLNDSKLAIVCPRILDINTNIQNNYNDNLEYIGVCITSGSLNNVSIWDKVGHFDDDLFIDSVDNDFCIKLYLNDYKVLRNNGVVLQHELGNSVNHFFKGTTNHNSVRRYYIARNSVYISKKYKLLFKQQFGSYKNASIFLDHHIDPVRVILRQFQFIILIALYDENKCKKILSIIRGIWDGNQLYKDYLRCHY